MKSISCLLIIMNIAIGSACNVKSKVEPNQDAVSLTNDGWQTYFENKEYQNALNAFKDAIIADQEYTDAYNGAGWASARLSSLDEAVGYFEQCIGLDATIVDAQAGLAFAYQADMNYTDAISAAKTALQTNSTWSFSHDTSLNYKDLHLLLAACFFATGDYSQSLTEVRILNSTFNTTVGTIEGKAALAEEIERLRGVV
ncbi:tetratricopeptide repeat protein [candidate division KSB1 bacterium]|nr:tetratricopeptide repeat protein [candidate division KSB1 bacterium]